VRELGADAVIDYKAGPVLPALREAAASVGSGGIDLYFDNVGADHLDAAFACARLRARFAICGLIDMYNTGAATSLRYFPSIIGNRIRVQGFLFTDYVPRLGEFYAEMGPWLASGKIQSRETIRDGLEAMPDAFRGLFTGANVGKMLVRL
jgi:NADPH-dependent curcumin reductase CurA